MKSFYHLTQFVFIIFLFGIFKLIGFKNSSNIGFFLGKTLGPIFRSKSLIIKNLEKASIKGDFEKIASNVLGNYGRIFAEYVHLKNFKNDKLSKYISIEGKEYLDRIKKNKKKVIVFAEDVAASGGYLIACAGDEIYANSSSIIGSIGVIYSSFGFTELIKKIGVERRVHTAGKNKSTLDPFLDEKNEDIERLKNIQLDLHKDFIEVVEKSRSSKLKKSEVELFSGEFWSGR